MSMSNEATEQSILIYTRAPEKELYSSHLANSVHLAYSLDGQYYEALNNNYGILYATSTIAPNNTINEKGLKKPYIFKTAEGKFGIIAIRVNSDGTNDEESKGKVLLWLSDDLLSFREAGIVNLSSDTYVQEVICRYDLSDQRYIINWLDEQGRYYKNTLFDITHPEFVTQAESGESFSYEILATSPRGAVPGNTVIVDQGLVEMLRIKWMPLENICIEVPCSVQAGSVDDLNAVTATAVYSDGSTAIKKVNWNTDSINFAVPGTYELTGTVTQSVYPFPLAIGYADPSIFFWNGRYYFMATNDNTNNIGLFVREAETVAGLFQKGVKEFEILSLNEEKGWVQSFWAPEFHVIGNQLYILFAVSGEIWGPQSHMMKLKKDGSIIDSGSWEEPIRVINKDGTCLAKDGITLDMTYFESNGVSYLMWSSRYGIFNSADSGSMLCLATIDPTTPWQLTSDVVVISRPLYGWENNEHTINNEGPYPLITRDFIYITYSGGAAGGYSYALGLLTARQGTDLMNPDNWTKSSTPVLSYYSIEGEYGPAHNTFFTDEIGNVMIAYHAQQQIKDSPRCTAIRRVHFNSSHVPVFDMSPERDLNAALSQVTTKVTVIG